MEIRAMTAGDLGAIGDIDATVESSHYLHVERAGEGLAFSWKTQLRPLREKRTHRHALDDEREFAIKQIIAGAEEGIIKGLYKFKPGPDAGKHKAHILGSGSIIRAALRAQEILAERYDVSADVWSATSYKNLRNEALLAERWNRLHPAAPPKIPYLLQILEKENGPFIAVSDYMKIVPDQIAKWVPGGLTTLGTDGFGRSDTRPRLRRFFEIDAECVVIATLHSLAQRGEIDSAVAARAIKDLNVDPEKAFPQIVAF